MQRDLKGTLDILNSREGTMLRVKAERDSPSV